MVVIGRMQIGTLSASRIAMKSAKMHTITIKSQQTSRSHHPIFIAYVHLTPEAQLWRNLCATTQKPPRPCRPFGQSTNVEASSARLSLVAAMRASFITPALPSGNSSTWRVSMCSHPSKVMRTLVRQWVDDATAHKKKQRAKSVWTVLAEYFQTWMTLVKATERNSSRDYKAYCNVRDIDLPQPLRTSLGLQDEYVQQIVEDDVMRSENKKKKKNDGRKDAKRKQRRMREAKQSDEERGYLEVTPLYKSLYFASGSEQVPTQRLLRQLCGRRSSAAQHAKCTEQSIGDSNTVPQFLLTDNSLEGRDILDAISKAWKEKSVAAQDSSQESTLQKVIGAVSFALFLFNPLH